MTDRMNNIFQPGTLKELCVRYHLSPSKQYGQHYLISDAPIRKIIEAAELAGDDTVVEVGPGFGVLTLAIAPLVKKVVAFEIEKKLQPYWEEKQKEYPNIEVIWGNILHEWGKGSDDWEMRNGKWEMGAYKVLANLPYQITSHVIRMFLEAEKKPARMVIMVQKEVAERICAKPPDMSLLAVSVQYYGEPRIVAQVPRGSFWPVPGVDSAVVCIKTYPPRADPPLAEKHENIKTVAADDMFFRVVKAGFAHPRKQVWRNLAEGLKLPADKVKQAIMDVAGNEKIRAEELSVDEWRRVDNFIARL